MSMDFSRQWLTLYKRMGLYGQEMFVVKTSPLHFALPKTHLNM